MYVRVALLCARELGMWIGHLMLPLTVSIFLNYPAFKFSCYLQSFEALNQRAVAVVVDPIQSVKGKVVIDAFRLINPQTMMLGQEPRQTTSNLGHLNKPSIQVRSSTGVQLEKNPCNVSLMTLLSFMTLPGIDPWA